MLTQAMRYDFVLLSDGTSYVHAVAILNKYGEKIDGILKL